YFHAVEWARRSHRIAGEAPVYPAARLHDRRAHRGARQKEAELDLLRVGAAAVRVGAEIVQGDGELRRALGELDLEPFVGVIRHEVAEVAVHTDAGGAVGVVEGNVGRC